MEDPYCPNFSQCRLVQDDSFPIGSGSREHFIREYCRSEKEFWRSCKRWIMKNTFHVCPDFVVPDTQHSPEEILERFEQELNTNNQ